MKKAAIKKLLYTVAKNEKGLFIKANEAEKGNNFFCPVCSADLILRKSGNTGKGAKRPHFAHKSLTPNCTPETALHYSFKNLLAEKIQEDINSNTPIAISWLCQFCGLKHTGNLLRKIKNVKVEYYMKVCQPDIALFDENNKVFAVIEIVVTHKPEPKVIEYYTENDIILIQINLTSDEDIDNLEFKISNPDVVRTCYHPKCKTCNNFQQKLYMTIIEGRCYKCRKKMKVATISSSNNGMVRGDSNHLAPSEFTQEEINLAKSKGVLLKSSYSKTMNERYIANTCGNCNAFAGDFYLFTQYIAPAEYGEIPSEKFDIGYNCENCAEIALYNDQYDEEE